MGDVIDVRPDRFLRELREGTQISVAASVAGISHADLLELLHENSKFKIATRECILEYAEEQLRFEHAEKAKELEAVLHAAIKELRAPAQEASDG